MKHFLIFVALNFILVPNIAAWSAAGHVIVAQIAKHYMDKDVIDSVQKYLGKMSFEEAALWMDQIKKEPKYDYMKPWHYVNIEKDKTYVETKDPDIINQLQLAIENLTKGKLSSSAMNFNIKVVFHLAGDIHQPLHVGYASDRGGNETSLKIGTTITNLHHLWDDDLIKAGKITTNDCLSLAGGYQDAKLKKIQTIDVPYWSYESRSFLKQVYDFKKASIDEVYIKKNIPLVKDQLLKAGIRLAAILTKTFRK